MGLVRDENALYQRKVIAKYQPAVDLIVNKATVGTAFWVRFLVTDENTVTTTDVTTAYDLNDYKTICDAIASSATDTSITIAKDAQGIVSITNP